MFVKYEMTNPTDYRGNVKLVHRNIGDESDTAYSAIDEPDPDMILLTEQEKAFVEHETKTPWLSERQHYQQGIDARADEIRTSYLQKGPRTVAEEYSQVENAARKWLEAGKPMDAIPTEITVWADVSGKGVEWAFNNIIQEANGFRQMLLYVRELRLRGKEAMRVLPSHELKSTYETFIQQLEAARAANDY